MAWKRKEENYIEFLYIKLYITIGWRGSIIGASKNHLGACYVRERDRAPLPPRTADRLIIKSHVPLTPDKLGASSLKKK